MPRIELIDVPLYGPNDQYHWEIDNVPLRNLMRRQELINLALDNVIQQMRDAIGTQGSVANRLNQSINPDGTLKATAIDSATHSIEDHEDTVDYVRMTRAQSEKLDSVADEANNFYFQVDTDDGLVTFDTGSLKLEASESVIPEIISPNRVRLNFAFPVSAAHEHYYDVVPVHANLTTPDYTNYSVTSNSTPFIEGSLRVYINGVRLSTTNEVYVPGALVTDPYTLLTFTPDHDNGTFALSAAISREDVIFIDFDKKLT